MGKSTLFNRLVEEKMALVDKSPGVTRDRLEADGYLAGLHFRVVDTAGLEEVYGGLDVQGPRGDADHFGSHLVYKEAPSMDLQAGILAQTDRALEMADIAIFMYDAREGVTDIDKHFAKWLRSRLPRHALLPGREAAAAQRERESETERFEGEEVLDENEEQVAGGNDTSGEEAAEFSSHASETKPSGEGVQGHVSERESETEADRDTDTSAEQVEEGATGEPAITSDPEPVGLAKEEEKSETKVDKEGDAPLEMEGVAGLTVAQYQHMVDTWQLKAGLEDSVLAPGGQPILLVANKAEGDSEVVQHGCYEGTTLGFGDAIPLSANHNDNIGGLHAALTLAMLRLLPEKARQQKFIAQTEVDRTMIRLAIVGKPNVGKSTLLNKMTKEDRVLTGSQPGVTRDAVPVDWFDPRHKNYRFSLVDTAGLKGTTHTQHERVHQVDARAMRSSLLAIDRASVVAVVLDVSDGINNLMKMPKTHSDQTPDQMMMLTSLVRDVLSDHVLAIVRRAETEGRALVMILNKWDKIPRSKKEGVLKGLENCLSFALPQLKGLAMIPVSAMKDTNVNQITDRVVKVYQQWASRISTGELNRWLQALTAFKPHPNAKGRAIKLQYITQTKARPPTFVIFANRKEEVGATYLRFLTNSLRTEFGLHGIPIRLSVRQKYNPYIDKDKPKK